MYKEFPRWSKPLTFAAVMSLTACGGGGSDDSSGGGTNNTGGDTSVTVYSGSTSEASLDTSNIESLASGAALSSVQVSQTQGGAAASFDLFTIAAVVEADTFDPIAWIIDFVEQQTMASGITTEYPDACLSGTATYNGDIDSGDVLFDACEAETGLFLNGTAHVTFTNFPYDYIVTLQNFIFTSNGESQTIENVSVECTNNGTDCVASSDFTGPDGGVYRLSNTQVIGNNINGYTVTGTFYHPTYGHTDFATSGFTYCDSGYPNGGTLTLTETAENKEAIVVFSADCTEFTVSFEGIDTTYSWADL